MLRSTLTAERHVVETELLVARQKEALDQLMRDGRSRRELDLARSVLATLRVSYGLPRIVSVSNATATARS